MVPATQGIIIPQVSTAVQGGLSSGKVIRDRLAPFVLFVTW